MSSRPVSPLPLTLALLGHLLLTALVWRDIGRRAPSELRGSRALWRTLTALNTGNHLVYLLVGRRRRV
ncbi:MAG: hypothetical protein AVDCRST_MAG61-3263 [uncultured Friedmanniella sp.]|uniref:Uncharacterized protein n=1 Tax=uncultured Friedmanniella sp. TaxID=335381 RepID=A0A6J4LRL3_9ACTN|nr:hypothetical protein [uncultured Friedmanniella sp.]CAA9337957.1 MAG: hypothetical protein AVDCRST_MAG61-3263 [uncultured Friedmanniella sp.]